MGQAADVKLWATFSYRDAQAALTWLEAIGFVRHSLMEEPGDPTRVAHAEMLWPEGGGIMFGSYRDNPGWPHQPGNAAAYLITDDVDGAYKAAIEAGGRSLREPEDPDYGGRAASVADPEGNLWSFGSYQPT